MSNPKFIVENNQLIIGRVTFHRELSTQEDKVQGGGYWYIDQENKLLYLYGRSEQFGKVSFDTMSKVITSGNFDFDFEEFKIFFSPSESLRVVLEDSYQMKPVQETSRLQKVIAYSEKSNAVNKIPNSLRETEYKIKTPQPLVKQKTQKFILKDRKRK